MHPEPHPPLVPIWRQQSPPAQTPSGPWLPQLCSPSCHPAQCPVTQPLEKSISQLAETETGNAEVQVQGPVPHRAGQTQVHRAGGRPGWTRPPPRLQAPWFTVCANACVQVLTLSFETQVLSVLKIWVGAEGVSRAGGGPDHRAGPVSPALTHLPYLGQGLPWLSLLLDPELQPRSRFRGTPEKDPGSLLSYQRGKGKLLPVPGFRCSSQAGAPLGCCTRAESRWLR